MHKIFILFFLITVCFPSSAQELNCRVTVNAQQVQTSDRAVFKDMETAFTQFMNNRKWTDDHYQPHEHINCNLIITLENNSGAIGSYKATVQVQSARPVYNSNYESILLNFADRDWQFDYVESQPLEYNDNTFTSNLTSLLAYYANIIIGMDYDSFSEMGGTPYFQKALTIVTNAQQSNRTGWSSLGSTRNRYWLSENLNNSQMNAYRKGMYKYHRLALDTYGEKPDEGRQAIFEVLKEIQKLKNIYPNSILITSFLDAKQDELINIFSDGNLQIRRETYTILTNIDPSKSSSYEKIVK